MYWDYYEYVKEHPVEEWNVKTSILYGSKDDLQDEKLIKEFCKKFNSELTIMENGEHFFHTEEQMEYYKRCLNEVVCLNPDGLEEKI